MLAKQQNDQDKQDSHYLDQFRSEIRVNPATGDVTFSLRGMARLAAVDEEGLRKNLLKNGLAGQTTSKMAAFLISKGFDPAGLAVMSTGKISDKAAVYILEYYAFLAGRHRTEQALTFIRLFAHETIRQWAYEVVDYKPSEQSAGETNSVKETKSPASAKNEITRLNPQQQQFIETHFPDKPERRVCRFREEFWAALERVYGPQMKQGSPGCAPVIWNYCYGIFPPEIIQRLKEVCPMTEDGVRVHRLHQHFSEDAVVLLERQISLVTVNLIKAKDREHFHYLMKTTSPKYTFVEVETKALNGTPE